MTVVPRKFIVVASVCLLAAVPDPGYTQTAESSVAVVDAPTATPLAPSVDFGERETAGSYGQAFAKPITQDRAQSPSRGMSPTVKGALIGAGAAAIATFAAASAYGANEGGEVCGACFAQWSALTVPVGAGIGAAIGWGIDRSRRSIAAVPLFSRKGAGVVVTARF